MTAQQLKNSILQMAVQGKLVPQDPSDEPASVLLERIRAEKEQLIKQKKIKREKNPSYIFRGADNTPYEKIGNNEPVSIADEVPFEIPDTWEWVRFSNLVNYSMGKTPPRKEEEYWNKPIYPWISIADMVSGGTITSTKEKVNAYAAEKTFKSKIVPAGTLIMSFKLTVGKTSILGIDAFHNEAIISIFPFVDDQKATTSYLFKILPLVALTGEAKTAIKGNTLNSDSLDNLLIPLPPIKEQVRIARKLEELAPWMAQYESTVKGSRELEATFPEQLKKSILQMAVQGKLVPQDPADEPASVLLERIRAEKQRLIKEGKIKKDKHESVIFRRDNSHYEKCGSETICIDDEVQFDIPQSWGLIRLNDIGDYRKGPFGSSLTKSMFVPQSENSVKVYEQKNAIQKDHKLGSYYIRREYYDSKMSGFTVLPGDIIVSCAGTIGETYIMPDDIELGIINQALMRMRIFAPIDLDYFLLYFDYVIKQEARDNSKGSAIKNIPPFDVFKRMLFPVPPIEEQKRIVNQVRLIIQLCDTL